MLGPQGLKQNIFGDHFYSKNANKLRFHVFLFFHVRKHMTSSFYLKWTEFTRNCEFCSNCESPGTRIKLEKFTTSCEFDPLQVKWWHHVFSSIKMEEYMEPELSGFFWVKMVAKNIVLGSPGTQLMHMRVKKSKITFFSQFLKHTFIILLNLSNHSWKKKSLKLISCAEKWHPN